MTQDFNKLRATNPIQGVDIGHQLWKLRHSKRVSDREAVLIYRTLAENIQSYDQVTEVCDMSYVKFITGLHLVVAPVIVAAPP